ncbi:MAG TPA: ABC transporter permease [Chryseolinea sp.]|nr:ABC transporter permease [Chryseolinea sp.]
MLQNYLKIALRTMMRNKSYSIINILGLSIGVACCLMLALYIQDEWSYDQHHKDVANIYRIDTHFQGEVGFDKLGTSSPPIAMAMRDEIPEIETAGRMVNPPGVAQNLIKYENTIFYETDGYIADSTIFDLLTYEFIEGNPKKALVEANSVVISESIAHKIFGSESALDKMISISQGGEPSEYKITGVYKLNKKSVYTVNFFISMTSSSGMATYLRSDNAQGEWAGQNFIPSFVKLRAGQSEEETEKKMNQVLVKYGTDDMKALGMSKTLALEPLKDIYLKSETEKNQRITYIYVIASIAVFILLIACINFMNLSTAKATKRANEVGLRKVMGAFRSSLIRQFMGEALVIVFISILISVIMVQTSLPFFNQLTGKSISFDGKNVLFFSTVLALITIVTGVLAGSYPAFYLSSFQPAQVLKGKQALSNSSGWLRRSLVVFQFMIAIALVCGMVIITQQLNYMQEKDLGFDANAKIIIPLRTESAQKSYEPLKREIEKESFVKSISATEYIPGSTIWSDMNFYTSGGSMETANMIRRNTVDQGYLEMMDIKLIAGRSFNENRSSESNNKLIVNRTTAKRFGLEPDKIVGQPLYFEWQGQKYTFEVVGVMEDYHQTSLKEEIYPTLFEMADSAYRFSHMVVDVNADNFKSTISSIEEKWKSLVIDTPFEYSFLDENIQKQYDEDRKVSRIITSFTIIAMFISCLGLYGLSTFMAERRFKEIGVRKVLGASVNQIVGLMSTEFIKLIIIAFIIAVPLSWYAMDKWLEGFAYKVSISMMVFIYAGGIALLIALLTVSFESIKAATVNPVKSLRNE